MGNLENKILIFIYLSRIFKEPSISIEKSSFSIEKPRFSS